jgi:hypothetical protein
MARLDKITLRNWRESSLDAFQRDSIQILKTIGTKPKSCILSIEFTLASFWVLSQASD